MAWYQGPKKHTPQDRGSGGTGRFPGPPQVPVGKPRAYFTDPEKTVFDNSLVDEKAADWAEKFVQYHRKALKTAQMRRFYDELKAIERKIMTGKDAEGQERNFKRDRALITMFKAKSLYAEKRQVCPPSFTQFIFDHDASIKELKDFKAFLKVFEAVVAFHKYLAPEK